MAALTDEMAVHLPERRQVAVGIVDDVGGVAVADLEAVVGDCAGRQRHGEHPAAVQPGTFVAFTFGEDDDAHRVRPQRPHDRIVATGMGAEDTVRIMMRAAHEPVKIVILGEQGQDGTLLLLGCCDARGAGTGGLAIGKIVRVVLARTTRRVVGVNHGQHAILRGSGNRTVRFAPPGRRLASSLPIHTPRDARGTPARRSMPSTGRLPPPPRDVSAWQPACPDGPAGSASPVRQEPRRPAAATWSTAVTRSWPSAA